MLEPGRCAAGFIEPPCDLFKFLEYDLAKWPDRSVRPEQVRGASMKLWKRGLVGMFGGHAYLAVDEDSVAAGPRFFQHAEDTMFEAFRKLLALGEDVAVDVELQFYTGDPAVTPKHSGEVGQRACAGRESAFATASHPGYCGLSFPSGTRPTASAVEDAVPYRDKVNLAFWRGSPSPARRCTGDWQSSPRVRMVRASAAHPDVVNASFSTVMCGRNDPASMCEWLRTVEAHEVPYQEQLRYRFLPTSAPECTYTGRTQNFATTNSITAMFGGGGGGAAQPLYGGLRDGVHLVLLEAESFVQQLQTLQSGWERLGGLAENAQAYARWALSEETQACYLYELLTGYTRKLAYAVPTGGNLAAMLRSARQRHPTALVGGLPANTTVEALQLDGSRYRLYTAPIAVRYTSRGQGEAAMRAGCRGVRARRPAEKTYDARQGLWASSARDE